MRHLVLALVLMLVGCTDRGGGGGGNNQWPILVDAEIDITGQRTGMFSTLGPTRILVAGDDRLPVTIGYYCKEDNTVQPALNTDGLLLRLSMPDTALFVEEPKRFRDLRRQLLPDVVELAVDDQSYDWVYEYKWVHGGWDLFGTMGFKAPFLPTEDSRLSYLQSVELVVDRVQELDDWNADADSATRRYFNLRDTEIRSRWPIADDYVSDHYLEKDTVKVRLKRMLQFPIDGLEAAVDSVRVRCQIGESIEMWNEHRNWFLTSVDSLRTIAYNRLDSLRGSEESTVAQITPDRPVAVQEVTASEPQSVPDDLKASVIHSMNQLDAMLNRGYITDYELLKMRHDNLVAGLYALQTQNQLPMELGRKIVGVLIRSNQRIGEEW